jgi:hypothetical protein
VSAIEACPLVLTAYTIISGAVGRFELRASPADAATVLADAALGAGAAAVGGPIEMAGIAGRPAPAGCGRAPASARACPPGDVAPRSMGRVTTTAGADAGGCGAPTGETLVPEAGGTAAGTALAEDG